MATAWPQRPASSCPTIKLTCVYWVLGGTSVDSRMCGGQITPAPDVILSAAIVLVKVNPQEERADKCYQPA